MVYIILIIIFNFIFQNSILPYIAIFNIIPNTSLIIIVVLSLFKGRITGGLVGLVFGLLEDILFSPIIGVKAIIYFFIGYTIGKLDDRVSLDNIILPILLTIISTMAYHFSYAMFMFFLRYNVNILALIREVIFIESIYNMVVSIIIYKIFSRLFNVPTLRFDR